MITLLRLIIFTMAFLGIKLSEQTVQADLYSDPGGFSFNYPEGWFPISKSDHGQLSDALPQEVKDWLAKNNADLSMLSIMVIRAGEGDFLETINVTSQQGQVPVKSSSTGEVITSLTKQYQSVGARIENVTAVVRQVASRDVYMVDYVLTLPAADASARQRQFIIPGGGKTFFVTCSSTPEAFATYEPIFDQMLSSFQAPAVIRNSVSGSALVGGIAGLIGGLVAVLIGLMKRFSRNSRAS